MWDGGRSERRWEKDGLVNHSGRAVTNSRPPLFPPTYSKEHTCEGPVASHKRRREKPIFSLHFLFFFWAKTRAVSGEKISSPKSSFFFVFPWNSFRSCCRHGMERRQRRRRKRRRRGLFLFPFLTRERPKLTARMTDFSRQEEEEEKGDALTGLFCVFPFPVSWLPLGVENVEK